MRITFALPFINLTGGIRVMLDYANWLHDAGHTVTVVYPRWPYQFQYTRRQQWGEFKKHVKQGGHLPWFRLRAPLECVPLIQTLFLPKADLVVAVGWAVAKDVAHLADSRGRKVAIVFHHESGTGPENDVRALYHLPFYRIAFSRFVRDSIASTFGCRIHDVVPNGVDPSLFYPGGAAELDSVLMLYHPDPRKGADDGVAALTKLREKMPNVKFRVCGPVRPTELPSWLPFEFHPDDATMRRRYSQSTVLLYPSRHEGFALPPLEAMACGCPSVTTDVGAVPEYARDDVNATIVRVGDVDGMVGGLLAYLQQPERRARHSRAGIKTAEQFALNRVAPLFAKALMNAMLALMLFAGSAAAQSTGSIRGTITTSAKGAAPVRVTPDGILLRSRSCQASPSRQEVLSRPEMPSRQELCKDRFLSRLPHVLSGDYLHANYDNHRSVCPTGNRGATNCSGTSAG